MYLSPKSCLLCGNSFMARDVRRDELCGDCVQYRDTVKRYRGTGGCGSIDEMTKRRILNSKTLRYGTGMMFNAIDKKNNPALRGKDGQSA
jgi:hypothetical protein